ncbi:glycosyltransferase family 2 protein [Bacteroidota bacterium]
MRNCDIYILNYNGKHLLSDCLPSIIQAVEARGNIDEMLLIDNASTDDSIEFMKHTYSQIKIIEKKENNFLFSINEEIDKSNKDYFIFLNNDIRVDIGFITPLLEWFDDDQIFATTSKIYDWEGRYLQTGKRFISFKKYTFNSWYDFDIQYSCHTLFASGGASAYDRKKFIKLGGFDELFKPFYIEDVDISYRAWKAGYKIVYSPESVIYHKGRATIEKHYRSKEIDKVFLKNTLIFIWKNITDIEFFALHLMLIPYRLVRVTLTSPPALSYKYFKTILTFPYIYMKRIQTRKQFKLSDRETFCLINSCEKILLRKSTCN